MIVKFNSLDRMEKPQITLCNPGSRYEAGRLTNVIGMLSGCSDEEGVFNFNATSEFNFRLNMPDNKYKFSSNAEDGFPKRMYDAVLSRRLLFIENIGYFMISEVEEVIDAKGIYKDIKAESIDVELRLKALPYIEDGTHRFLSYRTNKGVLDTIVEALPLWSVGHVDEAVANRWRSFEDVSDTENCLNFLLKDIQDAYECIVVFDIVTREINVYDQANYVHGTNIHITNDDFVNSLKVRSDNNDLYTAIRVTGDDDVSIGLVNPIGGSVIYNFDYFLDWMSPGLQAKVRQWKEGIAGAAEEFYQLRLEWSQNTQASMTYQAEIDRLAAQIEIYSNCLPSFEGAASVNRRYAGKSVGPATDNDDTFIASILESANIQLLKLSGKAIPIPDRDEHGYISIDVDWTKRQIRGLIAAVDNAMNDKAAIKANVDATIEYQNNLIKDIVDTYAIDKYFTDAEFVELRNYIFEGSYSDEHVTITDTMDEVERYEQRRILYDRAVAQLEKISQPSQEFDVDMENILFEKSFAEWVEQIETGCLINVEIRQDDVAMLFLSNITINYDDHKLTMKYGNRYNRFDTKSLFENALGKINKSANTLNFVKDLVYPIKRGDLNYMQEAIQNSRNLTMNSFISSDGETVVIDSTGYTGRQLLSDGSFDPRQIKIIGKGIVLTGDGWQTSQLAIGEIILDNGASVYGVNAQALIGDVIIGNKLKIVDDSGNDLLDVVDGRISTMVADQANGQFTALQETANNLTIEIGKVQQSVDEGLSHIEPITGYVFDENGLSIHRDGDEIVSLVDNRGLRVGKAANGEDQAVISENILTADNTGVDAINLRSRQYLIIGKHSRFEDYGDGGTACYYIDEPSDQSAE